MKPEEVGTVFARLAKQNNEREEMRKRADFNTASELIDKLEKLFSLPQNHDTLMICEPRLSSLASSLKMRLSLDARRKASA